MENLQTELLNKLPSEMVIDILSRLPIRTIVICKCVCRAWRDLLCSRDFIDVHLSKSVPGLVIHDGLGQPDSLRILEYDDEDGDVPYKLLRYMEHHRWYNLRGSVNGLLLLTRREPGFPGNISGNNWDIPYVCNPITREYIKLSYDCFNHPCFGNKKFVYGFGVSRMTGRYKVVSILQVYGFWASTFMSISKSICRVYTLGTGKWRSITPPPPFNFNSERSMNGNIHWMAQSSYDSFCICVLDLDSENFSTLSFPALDIKTLVPSLFVLRGCLCLCHTNGYGDEVAIWLMKEYGDEKSWTKEFVIRKSYGLVDLSKEWFSVGAIKVFGDGDILMAWHNMYMIYYSNKTKTVKRIDLIGDDDMFKGRYMSRMDHMRLMDHTSSFFSLTSFANETVSRF